MFNRYQITDLIGIFKLVQLERTIYRRSGLYAPVVRVGYVCACCTFVDSYLLTLSRAVHEKLNTYKMFEIKFSG